MLVNFIQDCLINIILNIRSLRISSDLKTDKFNDI